MNFLNNIISLLGAFCDVNYLTIWFFPLVAICFLASIPAIIRVLTTWR